MRRTWRKWTYTPRNSRYGSMFVLLVTLSIFVAGLAAEAVWVRPVMDRMLSR